VLKTKNFKSLALADQTAGKKIKLFDSAS